MHDEQGSETVTNHVIVHSSKKCQNYCDAIRFCIPLAYPAWFHKLSEELAQAD